MINAYYNTGDFILYKGDSLELLNHIDTKVDMIFADPPYFLSTGNGKVNINGQYIKFDKGQWDRVRTRNEGKRLRVYTLHNSKKAVTAD